MITPANGGGAEVFFYCLVKKDVGDFDVMHLIATINNNRLPDGKTFQVLAGNTLLLVLTPTDSLARAFRLAGGRVLQN